VCAHHADAPFLRGGAPGPPPDLAGWERPIFDQVSRQLPATIPAPVQIDRELGDGDELPFGGGGAITVAVPGHTPAASLSTFPRGVSCSPPRPSGGWPAWTPTSPASATENPSSRTQPPKRGQSPGNSMITRSEIAGVVTENTHYPNTQSPSPVTDDAEIFPARHQARDQPVLKAFEFRLISVGVPSRAARWSSHGMKRT
jgi:hypothetical protein